MHAMRWAIAPILALTVVSGTAQAQPSDCPAKHVCVEYTNEDGSKDVLEIDPKQGHYQEIVVEVRTTEIDAFSGHSKEVTVTLAPYLSDGDSYALQPLIVEEKAGIYADADLGDVYTLEEAQ